MPPRLPSPRPRALAAAALAAALSPACGRAPADSPPPPAAPASQSAQAAPAPPGPASAVAFSAASLGDLPFAASRWPLPAGAEHYRPPRCAPPPREIPPLPDHVAPAWRKLQGACAGGDQGACADLAQKMLHGKGGPEEGHLALAMAHAACEKGSAAACAVAADAYLYRIGAPHSLECAELLLQRACDAGDQAACGDLGQRLKFGRGTRYDPARAEALLAKACPSGECPSRSSWLDREGNEAARCDEGDLEACIDLTFGNPGPEPGKALALLRRACEGGSSRGCWAIARLYQEHQAEVTAAWKLACERGELHACDELLHPELQYHGMEAWTPPPLKAEEREALTRRACAQGGARQCRELAEARGDAPEALGLLERACPLVRSRGDGRAVDPKACKALGDRLREGRGAPRDGARAAAHYRMGCYFEGKYNQRSEEACVALAEMYEKGDGVARDQDRAEDLYAGLCSIGSTHCRKNQPRRGL